MVEQHLGLLTETLGPLLEVDSISRFFRTFILLGTLGGPPGNLNLTLFGLVNLQPGSGGPVVQLLCGLDGLVLSSA